MRNKNSKGERQGRYLLGSVSVSIISAFCTLLSKHTRVWEEAGITVHGAGRAVDATCYTRRAPGSALFHETKTRITRLTRSDGGSEDWGGSVDESGCIATRVDGRRGASSDCEGRAEGAGLVGTDIEGRRCSPS